MSVFDTNNNNILDPLEVLQFAFKSDPNKVADFTVGEIDAKLAQDFLNLSYNEHGTGSVGYQASIVYLLTMLGIDRNSAIQASEMLKTKTPQQVIQSLNTNVPVEDMYNSVNSLYTTFKADSDAIANENVQVDTLDAKLAQDFLTKAKAENNPTTYKNAILYLTTLLGIDPNDAVLAAEMLKTKTPQQIITLFNSGVPIPTSTTPPPPTTMPPPPPPMPPMPDEQLLDTLTDEQILAIIQTLLSSPTLIRSSEVLAYITQLLAEIGDDDSPSTSTSTSTTGYQL
jgi:hypothetical protein